MLERAVAMQRARNEGNNFPFMVTDLAGLYAELGRHAEAAALQAEGIAYVQARFVPGDDGARYRDYLLTLLLQNRADALLHLDRPGAAVRTLAAADSVLARLPRTAAHHDVWRRQQCVAGRLRLRQRRFAGAEARLLACAGTGTPRAARSPFPEARAETDERTFRRPASADLVALYRAWGRPAEAAPYRADAARFHASRDSLRAAFQSPPAR